NLGYWLGHDYLGIGVGAVSTVDGERRRNTPKLARYLSGDYGRELEPLDEDVVARERLMLGLRLDDPLPLAGLEEALDPAGLAPADRGPLSLLRGRGARPDGAAAGGVPARPAHDADRGRVRAAGHHGDALAGDAAARARVRAAARGHDDRPRRGPAAATGARDGGRHHLRRRRHQAAFPFRRSGRPRARTVGERVPERN